MAQNDDAIRLLNELYQLFVDIGAINSDDISWPHHDDGSLSDSVCREHGLSENAIDVLKKIPWIKFDGLVHIFDLAFLVNYSNDFDIGASRYPHLGCIYDPDEIDEDSDKVPPNLLTIAMAHDPGMIVAIDVDTGMIREWDSSSSWNFWDAKPAAPYFEHLINEYRSLEGIPIWGELEILSRKNREYVYIRTRTMMRDYGWPQEFQRDAFVRDYNEVLRGWADEKRLELDQIEAEVHSTQGLTSTELREAADKIQIERALARAQNRDAARSLQRLTLTNSESKP